MHERPPRLPFSATRVLKASRTLPWGAKAVWLEDWALDQGPEGAWISAPNLAVRLGMSRENVEQHRRRLKEIGLYHVVRRQGAKSDGWIPTLPPLCVPSVRPTVEQITTCAAHLDEYMEHVGRGVVGPTSPGVPGYATGGVADSAPRGVATSATHEEGGRGEEHSNLKSDRQITLQPRSQDGEVAYATGRLEEGRKELSPDEQRALELKRRLDERRAAMGR